MILLLIDLQICSCKLYLYRNEISAAKQIHSLKAKKIYRIHSPELLIATKHKLEMCL